MQARLFYEEKRSQGAFMLKSRHSMMIKIEGNSVAPNSNHKDEWLFSRI